MPRRRLKILSVDPAKCTGLAAIYGRKRVWSGVVKMPNTRKAWHPGERFYRFRDALRAHLDMSILELGKPDFLVIEWANNMRSGAAMAMHGYVRTVVLEWARCVEVPIVKVGPSQVKLHATGDGNASKDDMMRAARKRFHFEPETHDEADALWIADYGRTHHAG